MENKPNTLEVIFPRRLKALRTERKLTLKQVSKATGLHTSTIGNCETGMKAPSLEAVIAFAKFYCVSLDYLTGFDFEASQDSGIKICLKIKELRLKMGYTESEFARLVNIPVFDYPDIEDGRLPDMQTLKKISFHTTRKFEDVTGFTENELEDIYTRQNMAGFAEDKRNTKYMLLAMKLKSQNLDPDDIILGVRI